MEVINYLLDIAVSQDGRLIACGGSDGLAEVWDLKTNQKVVQLEASAVRVFAVDVSPDSTRFATGASQNVTVWSIPTGQLLLGPWKHADSIAAVKFSPAGDRIATATWERNSIRLYDSSDGRLLLDIPDRVSSPYNTSLAWSNDGRQLFVASHAGKIKSFHVSGSLLSWTEWNIQTNNQPASIALAYNEKFIASASSRFVSFWDTSTLAQIGPVIEHSERVWSIALSKDGYLVSGGDDKKITLRNLRDILPQFYFDPTSDCTPASRTLLQSLGVQQNSSGSSAEVCRMKALRDETIQKSRKYRKGKDHFEQTMHQLEREISNLREDNQKLGTQVSDLQGTVQRLELECKQLGKQLDAMHGL
ncbi:WD40 repeat-like protein [Imleria badia]|nr:WD40 repeat-like protein [Imleria badia]